ncbi:interferon-induced transmembrane protein 2-like [Triplophysa rosa]|uniref:Interferon-induced transmembrane protein 1-like n=1 Tax=Triplophysa rosa TaxID=992332 RepID=A0A9W7TW01_TRIRA|nr:interferon-induced transmembrane protein 2-like [Triplophysa rosa]KAI7803618.1 putative interferon-induced transmembrane protein 1-like [Triplophysa rosa]
MEPEDAYEIPCEDFERENIAGEMIDLPELHNMEEPPKVVYVRYREKGKDHMCCSVFNIMFCNCLFLGLAALICSLKARNKMNEGDMVGAQKCSRCACWTNTVAVILTMLALTLFLVFGFGGFYHLPYEQSSYNSDFSSVGSYNSKSSSYDVSFDWDIDRSKSKNNHRSQYRPSSNWNRPSSSGGSRYGGRSRGKK